MTQHQPTNTLHRDSLGRLVFVDRSGVSHIGVHPVRAFPITAPAGGIGIMNQSGKEVHWYPNASHIPNAELSLIEEELAAREFMPVIEKITRVSTYATPSIWDIRSEEHTSELQSH